jgi:pilus assembly protein CpaC
MQKPLYALRGFLLALLFATLYNTNCLAQVPLGPTSANANVVKARTPHGGQFIVPLNNSQLLQIDREFEEVTVGNSEIANVVPMSKQMVYVFGQALGSTNLTFLNANGQVLSVVDLVVSHDIQGLKERLHQLMPDERIEIRPAGKSLVLSGQVTSSSHLANALSVAEQFAPQAVTNLLHVAGSQQVMLEVRFAEVSRSVVKQLGISLDALFENGDIALGILTGGANFISPDTFGLATVFATPGDLTIDAAVDALEEKGLARVLAEPNLVVLSGDTADFLAGGEFPIPIAQSGATLGGALALTVEFKEFGISLAFTPTVLGDGLMNIVLRSDVSDIDPNLTVETNGIEIPGLTVRRTNTTVELRDGQSLAISGLLSDTFRTGVDQYPWIGDVPILGALFRSSNYRRQLSELVVIVTPRLVKPVLAGTLRTPADYFKMPTERELFFEGQPEGAPVDPTQALQVKQKTGVEGPNGYILK